MYTISLNPARLSPDDADDLRNYIAILPTIVLLTAAQEASADPETLVTHNMRLSAAVACHYAGRGVPLADLIQEGNMGLMRAAETFDPARGRFSTYAVKPVRERILRAIHNQAHMIRRPVWAQDRREAGREAARESTKAALNRSVVSGDKAMPSATPGRAATLLDVMPNNANTELEALHNTMIDARTIDKFLGILHGRDRQIIELRFIKGFSEREVGAIMGLSFQRIHQIEIQALARIRVEAVGGMSDTDRLLLNESGYAGVSATPSSRRWCVRQKKQGVDSYAGFYACRHAAARAYNALKGSPINDVTYCTCDECDAFRTGAPQSEAEHVV